MEALLFKTNHRTTNFMKEENRKIKREDNLKRTKNARGKHIQDKRKISENLELTNGELFFRHIMPRRGGAKIRTHFMDGCGFCKDITLICINVIYILICTKYQPKFEKTNLCTKFSQF